METNQPPMHTRSFMQYRVFYDAKINNIKQSFKVICRFDRLGTAHSKRQTSHLSIGYLSAADVIKNSAQG